MAPSLFPSDLYAHSMHVSGEGGDWANCATGRG